MAKNYYEALGIGKDASADDIKSAYRKLAKQYHPDLNQNNPDAAEKFKEINEAYEVLSDSTKKTNYDNYGNPNGPNANDFFGGGGGGGGGFNFGGFEDLFNIFGNFGGGKSPSTASNGEDLQVKINISFSEAVFGVKKEINIPRIENCSHCSGTGAKNGTEYSSCRECNGSGFVKYTENSLFGRMIKTGICKSCSGTGKIIKAKCTFCNGDGYRKITDSISVNIPAGIDNNQVLTMRGKGNAGIRGGVDGDLHIIINVKSHKLLVREGYDLKIKIYVPFYLLLAGGEIQVPIADGKTNLKIPPLTQSNTIFKIKGKGVKVLNKQSFGDLIVTVVGESPKNLSREEKDLVAKLSNISDNNFSRYKDYLNDLKSI